MQQVQKVGTDGVGSVSTSMRLPWVDQWYQYSSMEPSDAISRSAMSRAPGVWWSSFSGSTQPRADTPVRITSMGWLLAGNCSSASFTLAGSPRRALRRPLYARSSAVLGSLPCTSRWAISSNSQTSAMSRMS